MCRICSADCSISVSPYLGAGRRTTTAACAGPSAAARSPRRRCGAVIYVEHAPRQARLPLVGNPPGASIDSGVCLAGLTTIVQPAAIAGAILRVPTRWGKFHGVTNTHGPTGWRIVSGVPLPVGVDHVAPVDAHRLLGEPARELGRVGDLRARLRERLAAIRSRNQAAAPIVETLAGLNIRKVIKGAMHLRQAVQAPLQCCFMCSTTCA